MWFLLSKKEKRKRQAANVRAGKQCHLVEIEDMSLIGAFKCLNLTLYASYFNKLFICD